MFQLQTFQPRKYNSKTFQPKDYNSKTLQPQDFTIPKLARLYNPKTLQPHPFQLQDHTTPILYNSRCYNPIYNNTKTNWYFHNLIQNHTHFLEHGQESWRAPPPHKVNRQCLVSWVKVRVILFGSLLHFLGPLCPF